MTKKPQNFTYWFKVAVIGIALGFALQFVRAWTEPTTAPPGGNVGAPINTGPNLQSKSGSLNVTGNDLVLLPDVPHGLWGGASNSVDGRVGYGVGGANLTSNAYGVLGYGGWGVVSGGPMTVTYPVNGLSTGLQFSSQHTLPVLQREELSTHMTKTEQGGR